MCPDLCTLWRRFSGLERLPRVLEGSETENNHVPDVHGLMVLSSPNRDPLFHVMSNKSDAI